MMRVENGPNLFLKGKTYILQAASGDVIHALNEQRLQKNTAFCDVTLNVNGAHFMAHKAVLAACSKFFRGHFSDKVDHKPCTPSIKRECLLLQSRKHKSLDSAANVSAATSKRRKKAFSDDSFADTSQSPTSYSKQKIFTSSPPSYGSHIVSKNGNSTITPEAVDMPGIEPKAFARVLNHIYAADLCIEEENISEILLIAHLLQIHTVMQACIIVLSKEPQWKLVAPRLRCARPKSYSSPTSRSNISVMHRENQTNRSTLLKHQVDFKSEISPPNVSNNYQNSKEKDSYSTCFTTNSTSFNKEALSTTGLAHDHSVEKGKFQAHSLAHHDNQTTFSSAAISCDLYHTPCTQSMTYSEEQRKDAKTKTSLCSAFGKSKDEMSNQNWNNNNNPRLQANKFALPYMSLQTNHQKKLLQDKRFRRNRTVSEGLSIVNATDHALDLRHNSLPEERFPIYTNGLDGSMRQFTTSDEVLREPRVTENDQKRHKFLRGMLTRQKPIKSVSDESTQRTQKSSSQEADDVKPNIKTDFKTTNTSTTSFKYNRTNLKGRTSSSIPVLQTRRSQTTCPSLMNHPYVISEVINRQTSSMNRSSIPFYPLNSVLNSNGYFSKVHPSYQSALLTNQSFPTASFESTISQKLAYDLALLPSANLNFPVRPFVYRARDVSRDAASAKIGYFAKEQSDNVFLSDLQETPAEKLRKASTDKVSCCTSGPVYWKRKMMSSFADSGTDAESSDSGVVDSHQIESL